MGCPDFIGCHNKSCQIELVCKHEEYWRGEADKDKPYYSQTKELKVKRTCCYCGQVMEFKEELTLEHLVPLSRGGNESELNIRDCCVRCNVYRQNKSFEQWLGELRERYDGLPEGHPERKRCWIMRVNIEALVAFVELNRKDLYRNAYLK